MRDLIIGCSTNYDWDKLKYWINSINQSGFTGEKVLVLMNCDRETCIKVNEAGFKIIGFKQDEDGNLVHESKLMVHVERFLHIYAFLKQNQEKFRYVITTDVKDVVFQKNPSDWIHDSIGTNNLIFSSESILYKDEPWGNQNLMETYGAFVYEYFKDNEIYNVGVLAGRADSIRDLALNIFTACVGAPIPICDQSTFNFLISQHPYTDTSLYARSEYGWAAQLGTTVDPSKINEFGPKLLEPSPLMDMDDGIVMTSTGKPFTIVHQYDRCPTWKEMIEVKYG
jgi:hypothetical protein